MSITNKVDDFQTYTENPFTPRIKDGTKLSKITDASNVFLVNEQLEKIDAKIVYAEESQIDRTPFTKVYEHDFSFLLELDSSGIKLFVYITKYLMKFNQDTIYLYIDDFIDKTSNSKSTYYRGLINLLEANILAKSNKPLIYYINVNKLFRGERRFLLFQIP